MVIFNSYVKLPEGIYVDLILAQKLQRHGWFTTQPLENG